MAKPLEPSQVLAFKPGLSVERLDDQTVFLIGERERFVLTGARTAAVSAFIDGRRTVHEIVIAASARCSEVDTLYVLGLLTARGHLVTATPELDPEASAFWLGVGLEPRAAIEALERTPVAVRVLGEQAALPWLVEALQGAGLRVAESAALQVVLSDDYLRPEIAAVNARALRHGAPWFLLQVSGVQPLIGPAFQPGLGPCWECLAFWLRNNRPVEELVRRRRGLDFVARPSARSAASARAACALGALAIARSLAERAIAGAPSGLHAKLLALDPNGLGTTTHTVIPRPQCPACGDPQRMTAVAERPIALRPIEKNARAEGGSRRTSASETYRRFEHLVSPVTGPVTHVQPLPERHSALRPVYVSGYLVCPQEGVPQTNTFDKGCAGKGRSDEQAKVSALCEAIERYSGVHRGDEARVRSSSAALGNAAIHPDSLLLFSDTQFGALKSSNAQSPDPRRWIPARLDETTLIDWTPAWSLHRSERRYVPYTHCYSEVPADSGAAYCRHSGNGVAAGTCLEEALLQAVLELCERDAAAIWWYNRIRRPAIDVASFGDRYFNSLLEDYERSGWSVWALDLTHDLGVPTCVALAYQAGADRFALGLGCHLEGRIAVERALTELNQVFDPASTRRAPFDLERLPSRDYLSPPSELAPIMAEHLPSLGGADLRADLEELMNRLERAGLELIAVDKSRPELNLSVVQAIVPGLRHFWPRFAPGRLYDVPLALGWLPTRLAERELNSVPLFL